MNMNRKIIKLRESNRIVYEELSDISGTFFEDVYRQADRTVAQIIKSNNKDKDNEDKEKNNEKDKDKQALNVISFLADRGRGKTSAMLSFISHLNKLQKEKDWSEINKVEDKRFLVLPYIDAAMLAEAEYIIDVILAEMWDRFEEHTRSQYNLHDAGFERLEKDIKQKFIDVRKAYLTLKEREEGKAISNEMDVPVPSALHELAVSVNLKRELQKLVDMYVEIFQYNADKKGKECYLVIAIDDVDMSGIRAHFILEQIRRFLCMKRVIVFITADIERLQLACEARYSEIYSDSFDRHKFINEYLEKVLPYNMRIYLPEIKERHDAIELDAPAREELGLKSNNEKGMILEFMAGTCGIYFDSFRRKRHFLQNQSMRSMVNYFEQMVRMKDSCFMWMRADLKERLSERISDADQKKYINELFSKDYEDVNSDLLTYITYEMGADFDILQDKSIGQVLYACQLCEDEDIINAEFVNAVIMFYSAIMPQCDNELKQKVTGGSLWGSWEYGLINPAAEDFALCSAFDLTGGLELVTTGIYEDRLLDTSAESAFNKIVDRNRTNILTWLCSMLFVTPVMSAEDGFAVSVTDESIGKSEEDGNHDHAEGHLAEEEKNEKDKDKEKDWKATLRPRFNARKNYLTNAFRTYGSTRKSYYKLLCSALNALAGHLAASTGDEIPSSQIEEKADEILNVLCENEESTKPDNTKPDTMEEEEIGSILNGVEILYSIGKMLPSMIENNVNAENEAYSTLVSSYMIIQTELGRRDDYFKDLGVDTKFQEEFMNSLQAKVLLGPNGLSDEEKEKVKERLGKLIYEYRNRTRNRTTANLQRK